MADFAFNGKGAIATYGLVIGDVSGWRDAPPRQVQSSQNGARAGATMLATPREGVRSLAMRGYVRGDTPTIARSRFDALSLALQSSPVKIAMPDSSGRYVNAQLESLTAPVMPGHFAHRDLAVEIRFTALDPYYADDGTTNVGSGVGMLLGTAPVRPVVTLTGATVTSPSLTLRDPAGATISTMTFGNMSLVPADSFVVDCDLMTVRKNGVNVLSFLTAGDFFKVDPLLHATYATSSWPSIVSNTAGTLNVVYRRRWR